MYLLRLQIGRLFGTSQDLSKIHHTRFETLPHQDNGAFADVNTGISVAFSNGKNNTERPNHDLEHVTCKSGKSKQNLRQSSSFNPPHLQFVDRNLHLWRKRFS